MQKAVTVNLLTPWLSLDSEESDITFLSSVPSMEPIQAVIG